MQEKDFKQQLVQRYADNIATAEELEVFFHLLKEEQLEEQLSVAMEAESNTVSLRPVTPVVHRVHFLRTSWFRYAAAVVLLAGAGSIYFLSKRSPDLSPSQMKPVASASRNIEPGSNKAVLTVGGKIINLSSTKSGIAVGSEVTYTDGGEILNLVQNDGSNGSSIPVVKGNRAAGRLGAELGENYQPMELKTPRGGQYQALLPDGSRVWLNAASSIQFPSKFTGHERDVTIYGEVYIEVAKDASKPFRVHVKYPFNRKEETVVQVLGTHFNINAYGDIMPVKATLLEGSIRVSAGNNLAVLKPGQQAQLSGSKISVSSNVDLAKETAWKNGLFNFNGAGVKEVMNQLSRWYDLEVVYEKGIPDIEFIGKITRNIGLQDVLKALEGAGVNFRVEGRKLIVMP